MHRGFYEKRVPVSSRAMRTVARDFPDVIEAISDGAVPALFSQRFLFACETYDDLVDAACWKTPGDIGARPAPGETREEEDILPKCPAHAHPTLRYIPEKLAASGYF